MKNGMKNGIKSMKEALASLEATIKVKEIRETTEKMATEKTLEELREWRRKSRKAYVKGRKEEKS
jgi:hypothetical protein